MARRERSIRTEGVILRRKDFDESDRILTLFTRKMGRITAIAKGARKPTSKLSGHLEIFMRSSFLISKGRDLHIISQAETIKAYDKLREDLSGIGLGSYVVELIDAATYEEGSNVKLYDLLTSTLELLSSGGNASIITLYYELHLMDLVGFKPELFHCVECGKKIIEQDQYLSGDLGGVICPDCAVGKIPGTHRPVTSRLLKYLRHVQRTSIQDLVSIEIPTDIRGELERSIQYYLSHTLEKHLNSPDFIKRIKDQ